MGINRDEDGSLYALFADYEEADEFDDFLTEEKDIDCVMYRKDGFVRVAFLDEVAEPRAIELLKEFNSRLEQRSAERK